MFLGQRYGSKTLPSRIEEREFKVLLESLETAGSESAQLVHQWYRRNENTVPPEYVLTPISAHFPDFLSQVSLIPRKSREIFVCDQTQLNTS